MPFNTRSLELRVFNSNFHYAIIALNISYFLLLQGCILALSVILIICLLLFFRINLLAFGYYFVLAVNIFKIILGKDLWYRRVKVLGILIIVVIILFSILLIIIILLIIVISVILLIVALSSIFSRAELVLLVESSIITCIVRLLMFSIIIVFIRFHLLFT